MVNVKVNAFMERHFGVNSKEKFHITIAFLFAFCSIDTIV